MSERISDEHMANLEATLTAIENDYRPTCESAGYGSGCPGATYHTTAFWRSAVDCIPAMLAELRERRAADLTSEEVEALCSVRDDICEMASDDVRALAVAVINKLASRGSR